MTKQEKFYEILKQMKLDIRLEVILADLVSESLSMDDLVIVNESLFKRNYHRDIESIEEIDYTKTRKRKLCFFVNRNGIYDGLPQDLLFRQQTILKNPDTETIVQEMQVQEQTEKAARQFFLPLEQEFYRQRVRLETEERKFLFETNDELPGSLFGYLWSLPDYMDSQQKSTLGILMPILNEIVGDMALTTFIIKTISGDDVSLSENLPTNHEIREGPRLGMTRMGVNSTLGGRVYEVQNSLTVRIYLKRAEEVTEYMPGGEKIRIHQFLCNLLIPYEKNIQFELDFSMARTQFAIDDEKSHLGRLNYTTFI